MHLSQAYIAAMCIVQAAQVGDAHFQDVINMLCGKGV